MAVAVASSGGLIVRATGERNRRLRDLRSQTWSTRQLARKFSISQPRVRQILAATGGDPLAGALADLAKASEVELQRERSRLEDRIRSDRRRLRLVLEELDSRLINRVNGLSA